VHRRQRGGEVVNRGGGPELAVPEPMEEGRISRAVDMEATGSKPSSSVASRGRAWVSGRSWIAGVQRGADGAQGWLRLSVPTSLVLAGGVSMCWCRGGVQHRGRRRPGGSGKSSVANAKVRQRGQ
jgi:hypothetical protein